MNSQDLKNNNRLNYDEIVQIVNGPDTDQPSFPHSFAEKVNKIIESED